MQNEQTTNKETFVRSHRHGQGKWARDAWGTRESCKQCSAQDAHWAKVREAFKARQAQKEAA